MLILRQNERVKLFSKITDDNKKPKSSKKPRRTKKDIQIEKLDNELGELEKDKLIKAKQEAINKIKNPSAPNPTQIELDKVHEETKAIDDEIRLHKASEALKNRKIELNNLKNPKPAESKKLDTIKEKVNKIVSDPKVKKAAKITGLAALGIGTGVIIGKKLAKKAKLEKAKKKIIGERTDKKIREEVKGTEVEEKVNKILDKSAKEMKEKQFSKQNREVVPQDIVEKVKKSGVIQKDHQGHWRIISMKTKTNKSGMPEFWSGHYNSKKDARSALGNYWKNKH